MMNRRALLLAAPLTAAVAAAAATSTLREPGTTPSTITYTLHEKAVTDWHAGGVLTDAEERAMVAKLRARLRAVQLPAGSIVQEIYAEKERRWDYARREDGWLFQGVMDYLVPVAR